MNKTTLEPPDDPRINFVQTLSPEDVIQIFSRLSPESLCVASSTCRQWCDVIQFTDILWLRKSKEILGHDILDTRKSFESWKVSVLGLHSDWNGVVCSQHNLNRP